MTATTVYTTNRTLPQTPGTCEWAEDLPAFDFAQTFGNISQLAGGVAITCLVLVIPFGPAVLPCAGAASAVAVAAGATEVAILFVTEDETLACKAGVFGVGLLIPGNIKRIEQAPVVFIKEVIPFAAGLAC